MIRRYVRSNSIVCSRKSYYLHCACKMYIVFSLHCTNPRINLKSGHGSDEAVVCFGDLGGMKSWATFVRLWKYEVESYDRRTAFDVWRNFRETDNSSHNIWELKKMEAKRRLLPITSISISNAAVMVALGTQLATGVSKHHNVNKAEFIWRIRWTSIEESSDHRMELRNRINSESMRKMTECLWYRRTLD